MARLGSVCSRPNQPGRVKKLQGAAAIWQARAAMALRTYDTNPANGRDTKEPKGGQNVGAFHGVERGASVVRRHSLPPPHTQKQWRRLLASSLPVSYHTIADGVFKRPRTCGVTFVFHPGHSKIRGLKNRITFYNTIWATEHAGSGGKGDQKGKRKER